MCWSASGRLLLLLLAPGLMLLGGCPRKKTRPADAAPAAHRAPDSAAPAPRSERCAGLDPDQPLGPIRMFGVKLQPRGAVLESQPRCGPDGPNKRCETRSAHRLVLGVLGDTKEALPATVDRIDRLAHYFGRAGVSAVVVLGGIETTFEGTRELLGRLKHAAPVLALPGDRESRSGFSAAAEAHKGRVLDLVRLRALSTPWFSLLAVPGYHLPHHLLAREQGCSYDEEQIRALAGLAPSLRAPIVLLAHGPPRGEGVQAVDRAFGQVNIGDPLLRKLIRQAKIAFGLFAHVHESAGHATTLEGHPVPQMTWSRSLLLNVGSADTVAHENLDGSWSTGTAAIFELDEHEGAPAARYRMLDLDRLPAPKEEPKEEAEPPKPEQP